MPNLWFYLSDDDEDDDELYEREELDEAFERDTDPLNGLKDEEDIYCRECGAVVEDGFQCPICGLLVGA